MNRRSFMAGASALAVLSQVPEASATSKNHYILFIGSRTQAKGEGIYSTFFDASTGTTTPAILAAEAVFPTAFALSKNGKILYATRELGNDGKSSGDLTAFAIDRKAGKLSPINTVSANGGGPTWITVDATGKFLIVAAFGGGNTTVFRLLPDGRIGEQTDTQMHSGTGPTKRQASPHAHQVVLSPDNKFLLSPDLGADRVFVSHFDAGAGKLTPADPPFVQLPPGTGPRQIVFHPNGKLVYLMLELTSTMVTYSWDAATGKLAELQTIPAGDNVSGGAIVLDKLGKHLYSNTRTDNMLEVFDIDPASGKLSEPRKVDSGGKQPWGISLDPSGRYLAVLNLQSNSLSMFRVDPNDGGLKLASSDVKVSLPVSGIFVAV